MSAASDRREKAKAERLAAAEALVADVEVEEAPQLHPVLAAIEERAGASDRVREEWLAERRGGITATEVRDLILGRISMIDLARRKLRPIFVNDETTADRAFWGPGEEDLSHVPVIAWGNEREPVIAGIVERGLGIRPETRVFASAENARWLASPDGVGVNLLDELEVGEYKTSGKPKPYGAKVNSAGRAAFDASGYLWQMVWIMGVLGAARCRYVVEQRVDVEGGGFVAGPIAAQWVEFEDHADEWEHAKRIADEFLAILDAERARLEAGGEQEPTVEREDVDLEAVNYLAQMQVAGPAKKAADGHFSEVKALLRGGGDFVQESAFARVKWTEATEAKSRQMVDVVDEEHPEVVLAAEELASAIQHLAEVKARHTTKKKRTVTTTTSERLTITSPQARGTRTKGSKA